VGIDKISELPDDHHIVIAMFSD